jgi:uncharacterized membrane protein
MLFSIILVVLSFVSSIIAKPYLPDQIPTHWNVAGEVDAYANKDYGVFYLPLMMLAMLVLFYFLPKIDPKKDNYEIFKKEWQIIRTGIIVFFAYLQGVIIYTSINSTTDVRPLMFVGLGALFVLIGNYLSKVRQNYFLGVKLPWTLASEDNWNKTHRFASWTFVLAGLTFLIEAVFPFYSELVVGLAIFSAIALPISYSYWIFKKKSR